MSKFIKASCQFFLLVCRLTQLSSNTSIYIYPKLYHVKYNCGNSKSFWATKESIRCCTCVDFEAILEVEFSLMRIISFPFMTEHPWLSQDVGVESSGWNHWDRAISYSGNIGPPHLGRSTLRICVHGPFGPGSLYKGESLRRISISPLTHLHSHTHNHVLLKNHQSQHRCISESDWFGYMAFQTQGSWERCKFSLAVCSPQ